jgi:crossover junction endodeoxyribonuclease RuvC
MVIGIDPGTATVGYAIVKGSKQNPEIVNFGVLHTDPRPKEEMPDRLLEIGNDLEELIRTYHPTHAVVEDLFASRNVTNVISVSQSRGVICYILKKHNIHITSLTPHEIKVTVTGNGRAEKKQTQAMVKRIYKLDTIPKPDDAADALAMAYIGLPMSNQK